MISLQQNYSSFEFQKIGESNNSKIYALHSTTAKSVGQKALALKTVLHSDSTGHCKQCSHLNNEYAILSQLPVHANIIKVGKRVYKNLRDGTQNVCAMELELGQSDLLQVLENAFPSLLDPRDLKQLLKCVAQGVAHLHTHNIAHNDLKLENVFLVAGVPKIADFGFARKGLPANVLEQELAWKTRNQIYLAPEISRFVDENNVKAHTQTFDEKKADIFALGVLLFQAVFLRAPFAGDIADYNDEIYRLLIENKTVDFWEHEEFKPIFQFLQETVNKQEISNMQNLLQNMLSFNPKDRPTIEQVLAHPWLC